MHIKSAAILLTLCCACGDSSGQTTESAGSVTEVTGVTISQGSSGGDSDTGSTAPTTGISESAGTDPVTTTEPDTSTGPDPSTGSTTTDDTTVGVSDSTTEPGTTTTTTTIDETTGDPRPRCNNMLEATVRDFSESHPDFEKFSGALDGLVLPDLGADKKPVHAAAGPTQVTSGPDNFKQWYNDVPNINQSSALQLPLTEVMPGIYQYQNSTFFPIDDKGFGNEGNNHNFHFTTEIHTEFEYDGGEVFTFTGDDDLWMFINGKLAIDLGGVHGELSETIDLDASAAQLGIVKGNSYSMDIFHAERHTTQSNFRIDTTIACFVPQ